ncbi:MAG: hypothetical protein V8Q73_10170 [Blautia sp.]
MEKYISFTVPSDSAISTVGQVLRAQGHLTKKQISRAKFLPDGIQKNGIRCRITEFVLPGDEIQVCLETAETASEQLVSGDFSSLEILYEDQDILAVNKPAGMLTHPSGTHYADTLSNLVAAYFQEQKGLRPCPPDRTARQRDLWYYSVCQESGCGAAASGTA